LKEKRTNRRWLNVDVLGKAGAAEQPQPSQSSIELQITQAQNIFLNPDFTNTHVVRR